MSAARKLIDAAAKARFVSAVRGGASRSAAAAEAGFHLRALYNARARDPLFRAAWVWAMELSAADEREARLATSAERWAGVPVRFAFQNKRVIQRRRMRWVRFDEARQQLFLDRLGGTADAGEAAEVAGVHISTVNTHRRRNPDFARRFEEALESAYPMLEAEALRQRLAAQERLRDGLMPSGEIAAEFGRVMALLARWDRKKRQDRRPARRSARPGLDLRRGDRGAGQEASGDRGAGEGAAGRTRRRRHRRVIFFSPPLDGEGKELPAPAR
jgi:hypothetical protein